MTPADLSARPVARVFGHQMVLHDRAVDKYITPDLADRGVFEPWETELVRGEIRPGDVVLDVGANIGYYTLLFAKLVGPTGRVHAFEPDPTNFAVLSHNVALNGYTNVTLHQKAVAERAGAGHLHLCADNAGDHRIYDSHDDRPSVPVELTSLDDVFADPAVRFDFVKFDIQGAEWGAIRGMRGVLARHPRLRMITEFWPFGLKRCGTDPLAYLALLEELGFTLYDIDEAVRSVVPFRPAELLARHPADGISHTNLLCVKLPPLD